MRWLIIFVAFLAFMLSGCEERFRYYCQDPVNWSIKRCQRPDCLFTQDCPDYLVAPVLEKKIEAPTSAASADR